MTVIAITGATGFVAANLKFRLRELGFLDIRSISHSIDDHDLRKTLVDVNVVFHLAGVNRPTEVDEFHAGNAGFTSRLCVALASVAPTASIIYSSSVQANLLNPYGKSKKLAEEILIEHGKNFGAPISIFRLTNIFGKWSRPNYNSVVSTFCYNISRDIPIKIDNPNSKLNLIYIDDVINSFIIEMKNPSIDKLYIDSGPIYSTTVGEVERLIREFREYRANFSIGRVGEGFVRALYSTYVAALPPERFSYSLPMHVDPRGTFVEVLKTLDSGQFSYFTAQPGVTRGGHYHHSKTEKFLVICGEAEFRFRQIETGVEHSIVTNGNNAQIVETVPGWAHDITNVGNGIMVVMLWANEIFDRNKPDTVSIAIEAIKS